MIIFVDTLFDADLGVVRSLPEGDAGVIWVKEVEDYRRFGVVVTDREGYMKRIVEKPRDPSRSWPTSASTTFATGGSSSRGSATRWEGRRRRAKSTT